MKVMKDKIKVYNRNLRRALQSTPLPRLKHGLIYDSDTVINCGNCISPIGAYLFDRIDIHRVETDLEYDDRQWSCCFKDLRSKEIEDGIYRYPHNDWMCVREFMEAYEKGWPVAPIVVNEDRLDDGNHRLYAQYKLGRETIDAFVKVG